MNYYTLHIGDYIRDTSHLSLLEHGIYNKLINVYYVRESPIPDDQAARLIGARSKPELAALASVLAEFFTREEDGWRHRRCDKEIAELKAFLAKQSASGRASGAARRAKTRSSGDEPESNGRSTVVQPNGNGRSTVDEPPISHLPSPDSEDLRSSGVPPSPAVAGRAPKPDPRAELWRLGVSILGDGENCRKIIGRACREVGEAKVASVLGGMAVHPPADPIPYFIAATKERGFQA